MTAFIIVATIFTDLRPVFLFSAILCGLSAAREQTLGPQSLAEPMTTLEWSLSRPLVVYRGAYEFLQDGEETDYLPQDLAVPSSASLREIKSLRQASGFGPLERWKNRMTGTTVQDFEAVTDDTGGGRGAIPPSYRGPGGDDNTAKRRHAPISKISSACVFHRRRRCH